MSLEFTSMPPIPRGMNLAGPSLYIDDAYCKWMQDVLVDRPGQIRMRGPMSDWISPTTANFFTAGQQILGAISTITPNGSWRGAVFATGSSTTDGVIPASNGIVKVLPFLKYHEFQKELQKAKFLFVPNVSDASPRVIVEAMCYNLCLLVNYNIVGGWKYVNQETGEFFNNEHDISSAIDKLLKNMDKYTSRNHFINNYGKEKSGVLLAKFIKDNYPNVQPKALTYATITI